jgi:hypothetical protein
LRSLFGSRFSVGKESISLGIPAFLRASFVVNDESIERLTGRPGKFIDESVLMIGKLYN